VQHTKPCSGRIWLQHAAARQSSVFQCSVRQCSVASASACPSKQEARQRAIVKMRYADDAHSTAHSASCIVCVCRHVDVGVAVAAGAWQAQARAQRPQATSSLLTGKREEPALPARPPATRAKEKQRNKKSLIPAQHSQTVRPEDTGIGNT
jgi:predicted metal-binding protein